MPPGSMLLPDARGLLAELTIGQVRLSMGGSFMTEANHLAELDDLGSHSTAELPNSSVSADPRPTLVRDARSTGPSRDPTQ